MGFDGDFISQNVASQSISISKGSKKSWKQGSKLARFWLEGDDFWGSTGETCFLPALRLWVWTTCAALCVFIKECGMFGHKVKFKLVCSMLGRFCHPWLANRHDMFLTLQKHSTMWISNKLTLAALLICSFGESFQALQFIFAARALDKESAWMFFAVSHLAHNKTKVCAVFFAVASRTMSVPSMWVVWNSNRF